MPTTLTAAQDRQLDRIERDRRRVELAGASVGSKIATVAYRHAAAALRLGHDPVQAAKDVLIGNPKIRQPGLAPILARTMLVADLQGHRRAVLEAKPYTKAIQTLSRADDKRLQDDQRRLMLLLLLDDDGVARMYQQYQPVAARLVQSAVTPLMTAVGQIAQQAAQQAAQQTSVLTVNGLPIIGGDEPTSLYQYIRQLGVEFQKAGFIGDVSPATRQYEPGYAVNRTFETAGVKAYQRGMWDGWKQPAIADSLHSFHYTAVLDQNTTDLCRGLDGMVAPVSDPVWIQWTPPNHWNCRSMLLPVWRSPLLAEPSIIEPNATADQLLKWREIANRFRGYF